MVNKMPEARADYCSFSLEPDDMLLWSYDATTFYFIHVEDVYARDDKVLEKMW